MALFINRFFCWSLETATFAGYVYASITIFFALILRLLDLGAIGTDFEISKGFHTNWRSHSWESFLSCDVIMVICHIVVMFLSLFMIFLTSRRHFLITLNWTKAFVILFGCYTFIEFGISIFEFSYYRMYTFRLAYVVFIWLYWVVRTIANVTMTVVISSRHTQMINQVEQELRFSGGFKKDYF
ncbi:uncharacterized protein LOC115212315 [Octopus sinensis]|uniref:Uncharacterized protein LOC115212315 n=1 Tax=Octopus sinensis TaxID=2607531 RepID=A0A6P7SGE7_9MOLL|nr:uncharacterized protein LOC115212315 [Octopus sinensis]